MDLIKRFLVPLIVLALVVTAAVTVFGGDEHQDGGRPLPACHLGLRGQ